MKIEHAVKKETLYISVLSFVFSILFQLAFIVLKKWNITIVFGNLLGLLSALLNFFLMALTVQQAVKKEDEKEMKNYIKRSQMLRNLMLIVLIGSGALLDNYFNIVALLAPLLFPRIAIFVRPLFIKEESGKN